jgi:hypothetical protein
LGLVNRPTANGLPAATPLPRDTAGH